MTTLLLKLAGPLQAWGSRSRFVRRETEQMPTKSGVLGMLAAARGMRRTDDLTEFLGLRFGVRVDQPGVLLRDFQTAHSLDGTRPMPLSYRQYLADAVFVAAIEGDTALLSDLEEALWSPVFPLYLGRRSCPPALPVSLGLTETTLVDALRQQTWHAAPWHRRRCRQLRRISLEVVRDAQPGEDADTIRDEPLSFDPRRREYSWRPIVRDWVTITNPDYHDERDSVPDHDPMALVEEGEYVPYPIPDQSSTA